MSSFDGMLLFTGEPGVGKSTALQRVVEDVGRQHFFGCVTKERRQRGQRIGFDIELLTGERGSLASIESASSLRIGSIVDGRPRYGIELDFLESVVVPSIQGAIDTDRIILFDEIGPMQAMSQVFREFVENDLLRAPHVLGSVVLRSHTWVDSVKSNPKCQTFLLTESNRLTMACMMSAHISSILNPSS